MSFQIISNLILRDFRAYAMQILGWSAFALVAGMFFIFINTHLDRMFMGGANLIFIAAIWPFILELRNTSTWNNTLSLPVSRSAFVTARYFISLLIAVVNLILWVGAFFLLHNLLNVDAQYIISGKNILYVWMDIVLHLAIFYFVYFRFKLVTAVIVYFAAMLIPQVLRAIFSSEIIPMSDSIVANFNLFSAGSVVAIVLMVVSYFSSMAGFRRRSL